MNWALTADGMAYSAKHRADVPVDSPSAAASTYGGRHRAEGA